MTVLHTRRLDVVLETRNPWKSWALRDDVGIGVRLGPLVMLWWYR